MKRIALPTVAFGEGVALSRASGYLPCTLVVTKHLLRTMRLTGILILATCLHVSANGVGQNVTLSVKDASLEKVFTEIIRQSGTSIIYNNVSIKNAKPVTLKVENATVDQVLDLCLQGQPFSYVREKGYIIVKPVSVEVLTPQVTLPSAASPPITGIIRDANGVPLAGVNIVVKGTKRGTTSNADGTFLIEAKDGEVLIFSSIGYSATEKKVGSSFIMEPVVLQLSDSKLDEVQIIAYGTTTKRLSTGNISSVKAGDIEKQPVSNPLLALAGRVPGLMITQSTGVAGGSVTVRIQGQNSISNGNKPFYVVDGVPYLYNPSAPTGFFLNVDGANGGSPLNYINPGDIESIEILKDADATAIYGSRAANGAILITTKKGRLGMLKVDLNVQRGVGKVAQRMKMMNTEQYLAMRKEALQNDGLTIPSTPEPAYYDLTVYDQHRYTDWQNELIGKTSGYTDVQASVSGGTSTFRGLLGASYHSETSVFPGHYKDVKGNVHFNVSGNSVNQRFQFQVTGSYLLDNNKLPGKDLTQNALTLVPNAPALYDDNGNLNWALYNGTPTWLNPLAYTIQKFDNQTSNLLSNATLSYELLKGLVLKSNFGYNGAFADMYANSPQAILPPNFPVNFRFANYQTNINTTWNAEPQLEYQLNRNFGKLTFLAGSAFQNTRSKSLLIIGSGYSDDSQLENISAATLKNVYMDMSDYNYNALFGRINYAHKNKYLLNLSFRKDGSSRFGSENLVHNFYSAGAAWIFSQEPWFRKNLSLISYGKLKASYGSIGSDQIPDYRFMSLYNAYPTHIPYGNGISIRPSGHSNPYLQWEETRKLNIGLDLGVLNDRFLFNINYYRNRSSNQLLGYDLPIITGFSFIFQNLDATVQNNGMELMMSADISNKRDFRWSASANVSYNRNKLLKYPNLELSSAGNYYVIGEPLTIKKVFSFAGVDAQTGLYQFKRSDGSFSSSPAYDIDQYVLINTTPKYFGGLNNSFNYKNFSLDFLFQFVKQRGQDFSYFGINNPGYYSSGTGNQPVRVLDRWRKQGDIAEFQKFSTNSSSYYYLIASDFVYRDASFIRLKNLSLSWSVPPGWLQKARLQNARLYLQGQNLLTFTSYKGLDPETQSLDLPPLKVWTIGFRVTL